MSKIIKEDVPQLPDWLTLTQAAESLKWSRQYTHRQAADGFFKSLTRVGNTYIVSAYEVLDLVLRAHPFEQENY